MTSSSQTAQPFHWPHDARAAVSLSFDDARVSQADVGIPILDRHGVRASFYVSFKNMNQRLDAWREALKAGHEIGNHTVSHPCTGNFDWSRDRALEDFTLERMERELVDANDTIRDTFGFDVTTFAYPCGQTFVGRGAALQSYVPLVAKHFRAGRGFRNEYVNTPTFCDLALLGAFDVDGMDVASCVQLIEQAAEQRAWIVLAAHEVAERPRQAMSPAALDELCRYLADEANGLYVDTIANVSRHIVDTRSA